MITVVIPAYNAQLWLAQTVESCVSVPGLERVIIVDDRSEIPASQTLQAIRDRDQRVEVLENRGKGGQKARNTGIEHALEYTESHWLCMLDHDDQLTPEIAAAVELGNRIGAVLVLPDRVHFDDEGFCERVSRRGIPAGRPLSPGLVHNAVPVWTATGLLVHRSVAERGARFDPSFVCADDHDFIRQAAELGPIAFCDAVGLRRRLFRDGRNLSGPASLLGRADDYLLLYQRWFRENDALSWKESWTWLLNQLVKQAADRELVSKIQEIGKRHGWPVPPKTRARLLARRLLPAGS